MTVHQWLAEWSSWGWPLLANHLWQATLLSMAVFAAAAFLKNAPGRARYAVWLIASVKFALPSALIVSTASRFGVDFASILTSTPETGEGFTVIYQLTAPLIQFDKSTSARAIAPVHSELFCVLTVAWFTGCILLLALWWMRRQRFRSAMRVGTVTGSARERLALSRVRSWLRIPRRGSVGAAGNN
ncbi:MAG: hypothetical protein AABN33_17090 [Acidobacteriota bacterium]